MGRTTKEASLKRPRRSSQDTSDKLAKSQHAECPPTKRPRRAKGNIPETKKAETKVKLEKDEERKKTDTSKYASKNTSKNAGKLNTKELGAAKRGRVKAEKETILIKSDQQKVTNVEQKLAAKMCEELAKQAKEKGLVRNSLAAKLGKRKCSESAVIVEYPDIEHAQIKQSDTGEAKQSQYFNPVKSLSKASEEPKLLREKLIRNKQSQSKESLVDFDMDTSIKKHRIKNEVAQTRKRVNQKEKKEKKGKQAAAITLSSPHKQCKRANPIKMEGIIPESKPAGEEHSTSLSMTTKMAATEMHDGSEEESDSESEWEDVEDLPAEQIKEEEKNQVPDKPVEITLDVPDLMRRKRKKKGFDMEAWFQRQVNRYKKETQMDIHKVHILCLLAHGMYRNGVCNDVELRSIALSLMPVQYCVEDSKDINLNLITKFVKWFSSTFRIDAELRENNKQLYKTLARRLENQAAASEAEMVMLFVLLLRSVGAKVRLVYSLQPLTHKPTDTVKRRKKPEVIEIDSRENSPESEKKQDQSKAKKTTSNPISSQSKASKKKSAEPKAAKDHGPQPKNRAARRSSKNVDYKEINLCEDSEEEKKDLKEKKRKRKEMKESNVVELSSESDFEEETRSFRSPPESKKKASKKNKRVLSSSSEDSIEIVKQVIKEKGCDFWVEVYQAKPERWICVDCVRGKVDRPRELGSHATKPICYIVAYANDNHVKDVTRRYDSNFMSQTRKLRVDQEWWDITLLPYKTPDSLSDQTENLQLEARLMKQPLPTSITEFKSHPLYALKRHLLKFEAIYPDTSVPVGYVRGEAVYARECVHTLHTRETWVKEGRCVRVNEMPYKLVKARKKRREPAGGSADNAMAEVFGFWQTEEYMPPPAYNGKVPRNEYGNIELFKPWMLPAGSVHLQLPGLNKVARKLNVDCVPAMVGWDFHGGWNHPVLDGFVVCEEHKDILLAAWDEDQEIQKQRQSEKREKRVLHNWRLLTKSLLIKERLKKRFDLQTPKEAKKDEAGSGAPAQHKATDEQMSWPRNMNDQKQPVRKKDQAPLFPFEQM